MGKPVKSVSLTDRVQAQVDAILAALPATYEEVVLRAGLLLHTVKYRMRVMRAAGLCHIGKWARVIGKGGRYMPVIHAGPGKDAPCAFKKLSDKQYSARYRKKHKHTETGEIRRAKGRARQWRIKAEKHGDPLHNALFGRSK